MKNLIMNATFQSKEGKTLSYKELPQNEKVFVAGKIEESIVNMECTVKGKQLISGNHIYDFVPSSASLLENAMHMQLKRFHVCDNDHIIFASQNFETAIKEAKESINNGKEIRAFGYVTDKHYRLDEDKGAVFTSVLKDIFSVNEHIYLQTCNSVYCVA